MLTQEQLNSRHLGIGGSDAPIILGLSRYQDKLDLFIEKIGGGTPQETNQFMEWGNRLEPFIVAEYESQMDCKVEQPTTTFVHPEYPWMRANVDGLIVGKNGILECKTTSSYQFSHWQKERKNLMPLTYRVQVAHYCAVLNKDFAHVAVLVGGQDFKIYVYERCLKLEQKIIEKERIFWEEHVLKRYPPIDADSNILNFIKDDKENLLKNKLINDTQGRNLILDLKNYEKELDRLKNKIKQTKQIITDLGLQLAGEINE